MARTNRTRKVEPSVPAVSVPDRPITALAAAGVLVSGYLTWLKWSGTGAALCAAGSGCDIVQASRYAMFLWVPTALWGLVLYAVIGALAGLGLSGRRFVAAFVLAAAGVGFSLYLTALSVFDVGATCMWCLTSALISVALFAALVLRRPAPEGRKSPIRPLSLATYGGLAAVGAILGGAFVFAAPFSASAGYQEALARHLAQTKSIMYGAYW